MAKRHERAQREKAFRQLNAAWKRHQLNVERDHRGRHKALRDRQRLERTALLFELRTRSREERRLAARIIDLLHTRQHRDLEDSFRAEVVARAKQDTSIGDVIPSEYLSPRAAIDLHDETALARWNEYVGGLSNPEFVYLLRQSHEPTLHRPVGVLPFEEVMLIPAVQERITSIRASQDSQLQKAVGAAWMPPARGRKRSAVPPAEDKVALRTQIGQELRQLRTESLSDYSYTVAVMGILERYLPQMDPTARHALAGEIGRHSVKLSLATAEIVSRVLGISRDRALRAPRPKPSGRLRRAPRVIVGDLERIEHAQAARRRGRR
jgi:hypothetical protein